MSHWYAGPDIVIAATATESNIIRKLMKSDGSAGPEMKKAHGVMLYAPATVESHTYTIQVTDNPDDAVPVWRTLQAGHEDVAGAAASIAPPGSGTAGFYTLPCQAAAFRIKSDGAITTAANATWATTFAEDDI